MAGVIDLATYAYKLELNDKDFTSKMQSAKGSTENLKGKLGGLTSFLKGAVIGGLAAAGAAIAGTIVAGVKATADLEEQLSKFKSSVGATAEETQQIRELSQALYKTNTDSMEDIVATATELKKRMGLNVNEIKLYQQSYMDYAKTTGQANTEVVKAIDKISDAWGLTAQESARSLDMLKKSNEDFGTELSSVQSALYQVAPAAKALGLSFEETNGMMNMFAKSGLDSTQSIMAFNYAARQVKSPEEFKKIIGDIQAINDPTERAQKAVELFGSRAGVALSNVLEGTKNLDDFIVTMDSATGTVSEASKEFDSNFNVQLQLLKKQFSGLIQEIGERFMPVVNDILAWVIKYMPVIVSYIEDAINFIGMILGPFIDLIKNVIAVFSDMSDSTDSSFGSIKNIITSVISSIQDFIKAFIDVVRAFWDEWGADIVAFAKKYFDALKVNIESVLNIIKGIFQFFTALLKGDWEGMGKALLSIAENFWKLIKNSFSIAIDAIRLILKIAIGVFLGLGKQIMTGLWNGLKYVWNLITSWVEDMFNKLIGWLAGIPGSLYSLGKDMFNMLWDGLKSVWGGIKGFISDTVNWLKDKLMFWKKSNDEMSSSEVPSYDAGTPFVPNDQLAFIHRGEAVIPASLNPYNPESGIRSPAAGGIEQNITINSPKALAPSEIKRKTLEASRVLALEWGV